MSLLPLLCSGSPQAPGGFAFNIAGGMNVDLRTAALNAGWNGTGKVTATVTANIGSTSAGSPSLTISGSFPSGVALIVASGIYLVGAGGNGGNAPSTGVAAQNGGTAISVSVPVTITNNGIIGGGGGGGSQSSGTGFGGGGGAGLNPGTGGTGTNPGPSGTLTAGGVQTGNGGSGGNLGQPGTYVNYDGPGNGGLAVTGNGNVTWVTQGTIYGSLSA